MICTVARDKYSPVANEITNDCVKKRKKKRNGRSTRYVNYIGGVNVEVLKRGHGSLFSANRVFDDHHSGKNFDSR